MSQTEQSLPPSMEETRELGAALTAGREALGMTQEAAAVRANLSLAVVQGLEAERMAELGAPVFVRGFLIRYCRMLGLDEQWALERFRRFVPAEPPRLKLRGESLSSAPRGHRSLRPLAYLLFLVLAGYAGWVFYQRIWPNMVGGGSNAGLGQLDASGRQELVLPSTAATSPASVAPPLPAASPAVVTPPPPASVPDSSAAASPAPAPAAEPTVPAATSAAAADTVAPTSAAALDTAASTPPAAGKVEVLIETKRESWADIRDGEGKLLFTGTLRAGARTSLSGTPPIRFRFGNVLGAKISLDGQPIDMAAFAPKRGSVTQFTLGAAQEN